MKKLKNNEEIKQKWVTTPVSQGVKVSLVAPIVYALWMIFSIDFASQEDPTHCLISPISIGVQLFLPVSVIVFSLFLIAGANIRAWMWDTVFIRAQQLLHLPLIILGFVVLLLTGLFSQIQSSICQLVLQVPTILTIIILTLLLTIIMTVSLKIGKILIELFKRPRLSKK
jgi:hypothetical protein